MIAAKLKNSVLRDPYFRELSRQSGVSITLRSLIGALKKTNQSTVFFVA